MCLLRMQKRKDEETKTERGTGVDWEGSLKEVKEGGREEGSRGRRRGRRAV